jgi:3D (Asp-Asp-Asp) domain-containing protein
MRRARVDLLALAAAIILAMAMLMTAQLPPAGFAPETVPGKIEAKNIADAIPAVTSSAQAFAVNIPYSPPYSSITAGRGGQMASRGRNEIELNWQTYTVTAYTLSVKECGKLPGHPLYGITKSGARAKVGVTVAAGKDIPFGTRIYLPELAAWVGGDGVFTVQDRGALVGPGEIDVYFGDPEIDPGCIQRAMEWGRRETKGARLD